MARFNVTDRPHITDNDVVFAKAIWAEARGEEEEGMLWVGHVIKNRANPRRFDWPNTIRDVCFQDNQFECWNGKDDIDTSGKESHIYDKIFRVGSQNNEKFGGLN